MVPTQGLKLVAGGAVIVVVIVHGLSLDLQYCKRLPQCLTTTDIDGTCTMDNNDEPMPVPILFPTPVHSALDPNLIITALLPNWQSQSGDQEYICCAVAATEASAYTPTASSSSSSRLSDTKVPVAVPGPAAEELLDRAVVACCFLQFSATQGGGLWSNRHQATQTMDLSALRHHRLGGSLTPPGCVLQLGNMSLPLTKQAPGMGGSSWP